MAAPWACSMLRSAALQVSMVPSRLVWSRSTMSSRLVLSNRASLNKHTLQVSLQVFMTTSYILQSISRRACSLVDASSIHKIMDVSTGLLDCLKGFLHLLFFGDITAVRHMVSWRADTEGPSACKCHIITAHTVKHKSTKFRYCVWQKPGVVWQSSIANVHSFFHLNPPVKSSMGVFDEKRMTDTDRAAIPPCREATVARAASSFLETTATLQPLCASSRDTAFPMPLEPPHTTARLDMAPGGVDTLIMLYTILYGIISAFNKQNTMYLSKNVTKRMANRWS